MFTRSRGFRLKAHIGVKKGRLRDNKEGVCNVGLWS